MSFLILLLCNILYDLCALEQPCRRLLPTTADGLSLSTTAKGPYAVCGSGFISRSPHRPLSDFLPVLGLTQWEGLQHREPFISHFAAPHAKAMPCHAH